MRALIVHDDAVVREMLANFLHAQGIECATAADGVEAEAVLAAAEHRLLIVDWEMPRMDGLELCRRLRARPAPRHVHFVMLSVHTQKERLRKAFDVGVDDFLAKPLPTATSSPASTPPSPPWPSTTSSPDAPTAPSG